MKYTKEEQETIILFDRSCNTAEVYTFEPRLKRTMEKLAKEFPDIIYQTAGGDGSVTYECPKELVTIRKPRPKKSLSDREKLELAMRFKRE